MAGENMDISNQLNEPEQQSKKFERLYNQWIKSDTTDSFEIFCYKQAVKDMQDNLIRNSRTEIIDGEVTLIVTEKRINVIAEEMTK